MITKSEIDAKAQEFEIHTSDVQRDYIYGWILAGLFTNSRLRGRVFLKGGNALRKAYFASTRYSNDLDFGTPGEISSDEVMQGFADVPTRRTQNC